MGGHERWKLEAALRGEVACVQEAVPGGIKCRACTRTLALGVGSAAPADPPPPIRPCPCPAASPDRLLRPSGHWRESQVLRLSVPAPVGSARRRPHGLRLYFAESEMVGSSFLSRSAWCRSTWCRSPAPPSAGQALKGTDSGLLGARWRPPPTAVVLGRVRLPFFL